LRAALVALPLAALVCGCARDPGSVLTSDPNVVPANYRADTLAYMRTFLNDPSGVRGAFIAEPELRTIPATATTPAFQRYTVCLRFNAKDSTGKYQGSRDYYAAFLSGRFDTLVAARKDQCAQAKWQPFPELEKMRR
jgi:hypothetical protein